MTANAKEPERFKNHVLIGGGAIVGMLGEDFQNSQVGLGINFSLLSESSEARLVTGIALANTGSRLQPLFDVDLITSTSFRRGHPNEKIAVALRAVRLPNADFLDLIQIGMRFGTSPNSQLSILAIPGGLTRVNRNPGLDQYSPGARVRFVTSLKPLTENTEATLGEVDEITSEQSLILEMELQVRALLKIINPTPSTAAREPLGVNLGGTVALTYVRGDKFLRGTYEGGFMATQSTSPQMRSSEKLEPQVSQSVVICAGKAF